VASCPTRFARIAVISVFVNLLVVMASRWMLRVMDPSAAFGSVRWTMMVLRGQVAMRAGCGVGVVAIYFFRCLPTRSARVRPLAGDGGITSGVRFRYAMLSCSVKSSS